MADGRTHVPEDPPCLPIASLRLSTPVANGTTGRRSLRRVEPSEPITGPVSDTESDSGLGGGSYRSMEGQELEEEEGVNVR